MERRPNSKSFSDDTREEKWTKRLFCKAMHSHLSWNLFKDGNNNFVQHSSKVIGILLHRLECCRVFESIFIWNPWATLPAGIVFSASIERIAPFMDVFFSFKVIANFVKSTRKSIELSAHDIWRDELFWFSSRYFSTSCFLTEKFLEKKSHLYLRSYYS